MKCYHECPYFALDGGPSPVMYCKHPDAPDLGRIIFHPECDDGVPPKCPIRKYVKMNAEDVPKEVLEGALFQSLWGSFCSFLVKRLNELGVREKK